MDYLLENPLPSILLGILLVIVFGFAWLQTGRKSLLLATILTVLGAAGLVVAERLVQTDREKIEDTLDAIADAVERNDVDAALQYAHPAAPEIAAAARAELTQYRFEAIRIKPNLEIDLRLDQQPAEAEARFNVVVVLAGDQGVFGGRSIPRYVTVTFRLDGDQWKVFDYSHSDPRQGFIEQRPLVPINPGGD